MDERLKEVFRSFKAIGNAEDIRRYGEGHINVTYLVTTDKKRYILQKINDAVFPDVDGLMGNICGVTEFLKRRGVETLNVIPTEDGKPYLKSDGFYRVYDFIENTVVYQTVEDSEMFEASGRAFGEFQNYLADYDASKLTETIPHFHDTPKRFEDFKRALSEDVLNRRKDCENEIGYVLSKADTYGIAMNDLATGALPLRVTHNDTKLNNVLMDKTTGKARAVIDLDTIMPGSTLFDFGDSIRFGANTAAENERDLTKVRFDIGKFLSYAKGYVGAVKDTITEREAELLPYGSYLMTVECGMRFLADYLAGDVYFRLGDKPADTNLVRSRTQLRLAEEIFRNIDRLQEIVYNVLKEARR